MLKFIQYAFYFFSSLKNRGVIFTFKLLFNEWRGERKYHIKTLTIENLDDLTIAGNPTGAHHYQGASYYILDKLFKELGKVVQANSILDYGAGKGRAMIVAANYNFKNVYGLEIAKELADQGKANIEHVKNVYPDVNFEIFHANALDFKTLDEIDVFYLFNPFNQDVLEAVLKNIDENQQTHKKDRYAIYINPLHELVFKKHHWQVIYELKSKNYVEGIIFKLS